jgi:hypothetical protein
MTTSASWTCQQVRTTLFAQSLSGLTCALELRNRVYEFAVETQADQPRCVLPCLERAQTCQQLRTEYRPICLKQNIVIDWKTVAGYMSIFFPVVNGEIENVELAPMSMTIVTPWRCFQAGDGHELDLLPMVKVGLSRTGFTVRLVHDTATLELYEAIGCGQQAESEDLRYYVDGDSSCLEEVLCNRDPRWISDIKNASVTRILICNISVKDAPQALFYMRDPRPGSRDSDGEFEVDFHEAYFRSIGAYEPWGEWGGFDNWPGIRFEV